MAWVGLFKLVMSWGEGCASEGVGAGATGRSSVAVAIAARNRVRRKGARLRGSIRSSVDRFVQTRYAGEKAALLKARERVPPGRSGVTVCAAQAWGVAGLETCSNLFSRAWLGKRGWKE